MIIGALTVAFIVLKLCHVIAWSWLWVLSPAWGVGLIWLVIGLLALWSWCSLSPAQRAIRRFTRTLERTRR